MRKTIILLSSKRSGSTAIFKCFQKHSQVNIPHHDQKIENWEIQYWSLASLALQGNLDPLQKRLSISFPKIKIDFNKNINEKFIFNLWNEILDNNGGIVFDKSPQYLGDFKAMNLLKKFIINGNNVKILALIRDPKDTITSQFELWKEYTLNDSLEKREKFLVQQYQHLEKLQKENNIPLYYYEKLSRNPIKYMTEIYNYCELPIENDTWSHLKPVSIGRYSTSIIINKKKWQFSDEFKEFLTKHNYLEEQLNYIQKIFLKILRIILEFKRLIPLKIKKKLKSYK